MRTKPIALWALLLVGVLLGREAQAFYNAQTGRWLSRDPIAEDGHKALLKKQPKPMTRPEDGNPYGFTHNNPINRLDILGRDDRTTIEICNRQIENPANDCVLGCANLRGHDFYRWSDDNGGYGSVGFQDPNGKDGDLPKSDHPEQARTCRKCEKSDGELKYGLGKGKSGRDASQAEIEDCLKSRPIAGNYGGLSNNCNDWASGAGKDCGLWCSKDAYLVKAK